MDNRSGIRIGLMAMAIVVIGASISARADPAEGGESARLAVPDAAAIAKATGQLESLFAEDWEPRSDEGR